MIVQEPPASNLLNAYSSAVRDVLEGLKAWNADRLNDNILHIPLYYMDAEQIRDGKGLDRAVRSGCRLIAGYDTNEPILAEMADEGKYANEPLFRNIIRGDAARKFARAVNSTLAKWKPDPQRYSLRTLQIPTLFAEYIWLAPLDGTGEDLLVKLDGTEATAATALDELKPLAEQRLQYEDVKLI